MGTAPSAHLPLNPPLSHKKHPAAKTNTQKLTQVERASNAIPGEWLNKLWHIHSWNGMEQAKKQLEKTVGKGFNITRENNKKLYVHIICT